MELDANNEGVECLRLLNEIISDFDEVISFLINFMKLNALDAGQRRVQMHREDQNDIDDLHGC